MNLPKILCDDQSSRLLPVSETVNWVEAFANLATQRSVVILWGQNAGLEQRNHFTLEAMGNSMEKVYVEALNASERGCGD